jgi:UDP-glucuronate 4-epimerase
MHTILITGIAGFIGSHLGEKLLNAGYKIVGVDNFDPFYPKEIKARNLEGLITSPDFKFYEFDLADPGKLALIEEKIDVVIHLAAKAGVRPSIENPVAYLRANITATNMLLDWMKDNNIKKYLFASSSSVYGNNVSIPFRETDNVDNPISPYAFTKKSCELLNYTYHHLYNIDTVNLRFFTVYGPRQRPDLAIHKFIKMIDEGKPLPVFGDGSTSRDYTFVADTVNGIAGALKYVLEHENVYEIVNLGNNEPVSLKDLIENIYQVMGKKPDLQYLPMQPGDVEITFADIEKAKKLWNYNPGTSIADGLKHFVAWYNQKKTSVA